jgi:hypothetical protein
MVRELPSVVMAMVFAIENKTYPFKGRNEQPDALPRNGSTTFLGDFASSKKELWGLQRDDFRLPEALWTP